VTAYYTVTVKSRVDGQLIKSISTKATWSSRGSPDRDRPRPYQVQLDLAQATQARDQALLANAKVDLERYKLLVKTDAIPSRN